MIISERIFKILEEKGISQKTFSERTGIAQSTISDWKRKKTNPAADKILTICEALGVTPYELLGDAEGKGKGQREYLMVGRETEDYRILECYHFLKASDRGRILGYLQALVEKSKD